MALFNVIRIFVLSVLFNMIVPTGDIYSDIMLIYESLTFSNIKSLELSGCRACYHKTDIDLLPSKKKCTRCITKNDVYRGCGQFKTFIYKFLEMENENQCDHSKWVVHQNGSLTEGKCDKHTCCFETKNTTSILNRDCGLDVCKVHLDSLRPLGVKDLRSWKAANIGLTGRQLGGKNCQLLRVYSKAMMIPIAINLVFNSLIFYQDIRSGAASKFEILFLILLFYQQWRTAKILMKYFRHKDEQKLEEKIVENDRDVPLFEPFCESGFQVS